MSNNDFGAAVGSIQSHQQKGDKLTGKVNNNTTSSSTNASSADSSAKGEQQTEQADEEDNTAIDDKSSSMDEPDAVALSGVGLTSIAGGPSRLAGHETKSDDSAIDKDATGKVAEDSSRKSITKDMKEMNLKDEHALARRLSLVSDDSNNNDEWDFNMNEDPFMGLTPFDQGYMDLHGRAELSMWRMPESFRQREDSTQSASTQKRVRFQDDVDILMERAESTSSSDDESEGDAFPDLFISQDDPLLQRRLGALEAEDIDAAFNAGEAGSDTASVWDWDGADEQLAFKLLDDDDDDESDSDEESDNDSDQSDDDDDEDGDKTDEETEEDQRVSLERIKKARSAAISEPSTPKGSMAPPPPKVTSIKPHASAHPPNLGSGKPPRAGTFILDPTRASLHSSGSKIHCRPPVNPLEKEREFWERHASAANSRNSSPRSSFSMNMSTSAHDDLPPRPFTTQSTLRTMFDGNLEYLRHNDVLDNNTQLDYLTTAAPTLQSSFASNDDSDVEIQDLNMGDFMHVDDSDSEDEQRPASSSISSPGKAQSFYSAFSPGSPTQRNLGAGDNLLAHLNRSRGVVGSFRRNQHNARFMGSLASHPAVRASTSEMNAMQMGRRHAGNTPMTPARKKRGSSQDMSLTGSGVRKSFIAPASSPLSSKSPIRRRGQSMSAFSPRRI